VRYPKRRSILPFPIIGTFSPHIEKAKGKNGNIATHLFNIDENITKYSAEKEAYE
jgi:hypothetical protein